MHSFEHDHVVASIPAKIFTKVSSVYSYIFDINFSTIPVAVADILVKILVGT